MPLTFKSFQSFFSGKQNPENIKIWLHPTYKIAALIHGFGNKSQEATQECCDFFTGQEKNIISSKNFKFTLVELHKLLRSKEDRLVEVILIEYKTNLINYAWVGNFNLFAFGQFPKPNKPTTSLRNTEKLGIARFVNISQDTTSINSHFTYCLSVNLDPQLLPAAQDDILEAVTNLDWQKVGEKISKKQCEWGFLIFPVEKRFSYANPNWPYNPFVGPQEETEREKKGLADIADALFVDKEFDGFKIVGGISFPLKNATRLLDGILVSPFGVVLLELKDYVGNITIYLDRENNGIEWINKGIVKNSTNPIEKLLKVLRQNFQNVDLGVKNIPVQLRKIGAVVFTYSHSTVTCVEIGGKQKLPPMWHGEVLVVTPPTFAKTLKMFIQNQNLKNRLSKSDIETICNHLEKGNSQIQQDQLKDLQKELAGRYFIDLEPDSTLSTEYCEVFHGIIKDSKRPIIAKRYSISPLSRVSHGHDIERQRLGREFLALQDLSLSEVYNVQKYLEKVDYGNDLYIILGEVRGIKLDEWLNQKPAREQKIRLLYKLAETIKGIAQASIIHRALSPANVYVINQKDTVEPFLVNFELCHLEYVATLPEKGRSFFDLHYQPREVQTPGDQVTSKADIYSLGKLICLVLSGRLPFLDYKEQAQISTKPGFWENVAQDCGLKKDQGDLLKRLMSPSPTHRSSPEEVVEILAGWL